MTPAEGGAPLGATVAGVTHWLRRRAVRRLAVWWATGTLGLVTSAALLSGPEGWTAPSPVPLFLLVGFAVGMGWASMRVMGWIRRRLGLRSVLRSMESGAALPEGSLEGALELEARPPVGVSAGLAAEAGRRLLPALAGSPERQAGALAGDVKRLGPHPLWPAVLVLALGGLATTSPARIGAAIQGLLSPVKLLAGPPLLPLALDPLDAEVLRGEGLPLRVSAPGRERITLYWESSGQRPDSVLVGVDPAGDAHAALPPVEATTWFWATAPDGARTPRGEVRPGDPLLLAGLEVDLLHPAHTRLPPARLAWPIPPLELPTGTVVRLVGRASRSLSAGWVGVPSPSGVVPSAGDEHPLRLDGADFQGELQISRSGRYPLHLRDEGGGVVAPAPELDVEVIPDLPPMLTLREGPEGGLLPHDLLARLRLDVVDDYGLERLQVEVAFGAGDPAPSVRSFPLGGVTEAQLRPVLDLSRSPVPGEGRPSPGTQVRLRIMAVDNAPGGQSSIPLELLLRVPGSGEAAQQVQEELDQVAQVLDALRQEAAEAAEDARDMVRAQGSPGGSASGSSQRSPTPNAPDFQAREAMRQASQGLDRLEQGAQEVLDRIRELEAALETGAAQSGDLARDLAELRALLEEVGRDEGRTRAEELMQSVEAGGAEAAMLALEEIGRRQEELRDQLEASLQRALRAAAEADWKDAIQEARDAAEVQQVLGERFEDEAATREELLTAAQRQDRQGEAAMALEERLHRLTERLERLQEWDAAAQSREAADAAGQAREAMEAAQEAARSGDRAQASAQAREAGEQMQGVAQQLEEARDEALEQWLDDLLTALDAVTVSSLALAREQSRVREGVTGAAAALRARLRAEQGSILQGTRNLADLLAAAGQTAPGVIRPVAAAVGRAMEAGLQTMDRLEASGSASGAGAQMAARESQEALNEVARLALEARDRLAEAGAGGASALEQLLEELEEVAQQQGDLLSDAAALLSQEPGAGEVGDQVHPLAMGQEAVAGELGGLADHPAASELPLGDLEALTREAEALAQELFGNRLTPELVERQEQLFQRLLDAGRSLRRDDATEEREGVAAEAWEPPDVLPLDPELLRAFRYAPPTREQLDGLTPQERNRVLLYFQRLNR